MKIKSFLILYLIPLLIASAQKESGSSSHTVVFYECSYLIDSSEITPRATTQMALMVGGERSFFLEDNKYLYDSLRTHYFSAGVSFGEFQVLKDKLPKYGHRFNFQVVKQNDLATVYNWIIPEEYVYEKKISDFKWEIQEDTKELNGIRVQKAVASQWGRTWEAWFAEDIPIYDGPYVFGGLPGLIVEVGDTQGHYVFRLLKIQNNLKRSLEPYIVRKPIRTTESDFIRTRRDFHLNTTQKLSLGNMVVNDRDIAKEVNERFRREMNFMELEY